MKKKCFLVIPMTIILFTISNGQEAKFKGRHVYANPVTNQLEFVNSTNKEFCKLPIWIHISINENWPQFGADQVEDAIVEWNEVNANLSLVNKGFEETPSAPQSLIYAQNDEPGEFGNQHNLIAVDFANNYGYFPYPFHYYLNHPIAVTWIHYDENNKYCDNGSEYDYMAPVITEADVIINPNAPIEDFDLPQQSGDLYYCLQDIVTHEIGHIMGLNHFGSEGCIMNRKRWADLFLCYVDSYSNEELRFLYNDFNDPIGVIPVCAYFDINYSVEGCIAGENFYWNGGTTPPDPAPDPGGGCGSCGPCLSSGNKGISDVAVKNAIHYYLRSEYQADFDSLIYLAIENYSLFEEAIDEQVEYKGNLNEGGIIVKSNDIPSNRIANTSSDVYYENYPEFNEKLQIAINEFVPIFNKEFNCDCDESTTHLDTRQINIILDLIAEVKNMPISEGLSNELIKFENYLNTREDNDIKTDIINYLDYY